MRASAFEIDSCVTSPLEPDNIDSVINSLNTSGKEEANISGSVKKKRTEEYRKHIHNSA